MKNRKASQNGYESLHAQVCQYQECLSQVNRRVNENVLEWQLQDLKSRCQNGIRKTETLTRCKGTTCGSRSRKTPRNSAWTLGLLDDHLEQALGSLFEFRLFVRERHFIVVALTEGEVKSSGFCIFLIPPVRTRSNSEVSKFPSIFSGESIYLEACTWGL